MAFQRVARISELPSQGGLCVRRGGRELGVYRVGKRVLAMENACPHAGYPLHEGQLEGCVVICNGHGWEYDLETGLPPGVTGERPLARYPVEVRGDEIWIDIPS